MRVIVLALVLSIVPLPGLAQPPGPVSRVDAAVSIGGFGASHPESAYYDRWAHSVLGEVSAGIYWTDHLKSEIEFAWTREGRSSGIEILPETAPPRTIYFLHRYKTQLVSIGQSYQFGRNAFFHPFVTAGVSVDRERHTIDRPAQAAYVSGPPPRQLPVPALLRTETRIATRPFTAVGFKAYLSQRAFFRMDLKVALKPTVEHVVWKVGVGVDF
jgi:hypothetical protein